MGKVKWYKRDPNAALTGMMALSLEERGAYNTLLDLIYTHDGELGDDARFICGWLRCDIRVWKRIRQRLLDLGKIYLVGGKLRNSRADDEVDAAQHRISNSARAGRASAARRAAVRGAASPEEDAVQHRANSSAYCSVEPTPPSSSILVPDANNYNRLAATDVERPLQLSTATPTKKETAATARASPHTAHLEAAKLVWEIIGIDRDDPAWFGQQHRVAQWLADWDLELDILPTIRRIMAKPPPGKIRNLKYFEPAIADAHASRMAPLPVGTARTNGGRSDEASGNVIAAADRNLERIRERMRAFSEPPPRELCDRKSAPSIRLISKRTGE